MRILQLSEDLPPATIGGSGRIAWETSTALAAKGHDVTILAAGPSDVFPQEKDGVRIVTLPPKSLRTAHYRSVFSQARAMEVMRVIHETEPDLIHAHGIAWQLGYKWIAQTVRDVPCIATLHGTMHISYGKVRGTESTLQRTWLDLKRARWTMNPFRNPLVRSALNRCDLLLCVSDALKEYVERHGYRHPVTLHNGIDLEFWKEEMSREEARTQLSLPVNVPLFLIAGRIGHDKGSSVLMQSLPDDAHLLVAGEMHPDTFARIKSRAHVFLRQSPQQMRLLYAACDIAVVPSIYLDPFPTVCLEAMACSRPVVATAWGGAKEAVKDGETGFIVDPLDRLAFKERLQWCLDHRDALPELGERARALMEHSFSRERYLTSLLQHYDRCLAKRRA